MLATTLAALLLVPFDNLEDRVREHTLSSKLLEEERVVRVSVPRDYESSSARYPVLYVLDGELNLELTSDVVDHLSAHATVPEMIVVAVHNTTREWDMTPPEMELNLLQGKAGRADLFLDFFEQELVPKIDAEYRTRPARILVGHSHGGVFTCYALAARPALFRWHVALDTPMHLADFWLQKRLTASVASELDSQKRLVVVEESFTWTDEEWQALRAAATPSYRLSRVGNLNETHESMAFLGTILALKELYADYVEPRRRKMNPPQLTEHFARLSKLYGYEVEVPETYFSGGNTWDPQSEPEVAALVNLPPLKLADAKPFVGSWKGTSFHEGGVPVDLVVTLEARGDKVFGRTDASIRGKSFGPRQHDFTRVTDGGKTLEWGHLNQRGPGLEVSRVSLQADGTLTGVQEMVGIPEGFLPEGFVMPVTHVNLERAE